METILSTINCNCSELTCSEFVKLMTESVNEACQKYHDIFYPEEFARFNEYNEHYKETTIKNAKMIAEKKWKTEKRRQQYIDEKMKECLDYLSTREFKFWAISFFDFDVEPGNNGISDNCIIECNNPGKLVRTFEKIKDNKYFRGANGWQLIDVRHSRPYVKLLLPETLENEYKAERKALYEDIANFYRHCSIQD